METVKERERETEKEREREKEVNREGKCMKEREECAREGGRGCDGVHLYAQEGDHS